MADEEPGTYVGSGSFLIDRRKALEVLKDYQLPEPELFVALWARSAVASQATVIAIQSVDESLLDGVSLEVRFDGRPFEAKEIADPYGVLFQDAEDSRRRDLALGILAALRLRPETVTVVSGTGEGRRRLTVESLESDSVEADPSGDTDTVLRVHWGPKAAGRVTRLERMLRERDRFAMCPVPVWVLGREVRRIPETGGDPGYPFKEGKARGWLAVPARGFDRSDLSLYRHGVLASVVTRHFSVANVRGFINHDDLRLSASLSVVEDAEPLEGLLGKVEAHAEKFLAQTVSEQARRLPETQRLLGMASWLRPYWAKGLAGVEVFDRESGEPIEAGWRGVVSPLLGRSRAKSIRSIRRVAWDARVTAWLRDTCFRQLKDQRQDAHKRLLKALWEVPVFLGTHGKTLSMRALEEQRERMGYVPFSRKASGISQGLDVIWCCSDAEIESLTMVPSWVGALKEWGGT